MFHSISGCFSRKKGVFSHVHKSRTLDPHPPIVWDFFLKKNRFFFMLSLRTKEVTFNFFRISQQGYQVYRLVIQLPMLLITFLVQSCTISPMAVPDIFLLDVCVPTILLILRSCVKTVMDIGMKCP